jgi:hypothetical protein
VEDAQQSFLDLWENRNPHMKVMPIPEAVKARLIRLKDLRGRPTEIDGTVLTVSIEPSLEEVLQFAVLRDAPKMPGGIYLGMYTAPVSPWPHQEIVSRRLVESWPYSYMMCDEVGLGKTIEAALAIRSLVLSGRTERVLIVAPASLTEQWHRELAQKAMLPFELSKVKPGGSSRIQHKAIYPQEQERVDSDLYSPALNIVSSGLVSRKERSEQLKAADPCDIILVDEVLSVGDSHFKKKSFNKMKELIAERNRTVVIVSHNTSTIQEICEKVIWLHDGDIKMIGPTEEVADLYEEFMEQY